MAKKEPAQKFRLGRIQAAVWSNHNENGDSWYTVTVNRSYKDGDVWKDTTSYRRDDLPIVAKAADMAYAWIWDQTSQSRQESTPEEETDE